VGTKTGNTGAKSESAQFRQHNYHLLGYGSRGIENTHETNQVSWYASALFTF
jgi:hypothetical protein